MAKYSNIWASTLKVADQYSYETGTRIEKPEELLQNMAWLNDSELRVYYNDYTDVLATVHQYEAERRVMLVICTTFGTIAAPETQDTPDARLLRSSNLHLSWGATPNNAQNYSAHCMYSPKFTIFRRPDGSMLPKHIQPACYSVQLQVHPNIITNNGSREYRDASDEQKMATTIDAIFRVASAKDHPIVLFTDLGLRQGHPPTVIAKLVNTARNKYSVPLVLFALGTGKLDTEDPDYSEFYNAAHC